MILGPVLDELTWELALYAVLSLTIVRMLPVAVAMIGTGARSPTLAFLGRFGPRGLASIVFGVILLDDANLPHEQTLLLAVVATVGISVFAHGLTARPLTKRSVAGYQSHPKGAAPAMETVPAAEHRWRTPQTAPTPTTTRPGDPPRPGPRPRRGASGRERVHQSARCTPRTPRRRRHTADRNQVPLQQRPSVTGRRKPRPDVRHRRAAVAQRRNASGRALPRHVCPDAQLAR
jgi:hypothetical protein